MPYRDPEKQKAYVRKWSRDYQRRKKAEREKKQKELIQAFNKMASKVTQLQTKPDPVAQIISNAHTGTIIPTVNEGFSIALEQPKAPEIIEETVKKIQSNWKKRVRSIEKHG